MSIWNRVQSALQRWRSPAGKMGQTAPDHYLLEANRNIRELIEGVRYAPVEARFKVYIIDEVHMLSAAAFNALLSNPDSAQHAYGVVWWPFVDSPIDYFWSMTHKDAQASGGWNWVYYDNPEVNQRIDNIESIYQRGVLRQNTPVASDAGSPLPGHGDSGCCCCTAPTTGSCPRPGSGSCRSWP